MSIYTTPDGDVRASTLTIGMLYLATAILALLAWQGHSSLTPWAFGVAAVSVFASLCAAPGWVTAFWCAYVRKLPDDQIETKRGSVNKAMAWIAFFSLAIGAHYVFSPNVTWHWTYTDSALAIVFVVACIFAGNAIDEINRLRSRSEIMERRIGLLERALDRSSANFDDSVDDDDGLNY